MTDAYKLELKSITKKASFPMFGIPITNFLGIVTSILLTRNLGADAYGLYVLALRIVMLSSMVTTLGFTTSNVRFISYYFGKSNFGKIKGILQFSTIISIVFSLTLAFLIFFFAELMSIKIFNDKNLILPLQIISISLPLITFKNLIDSDLRGLK